MLAEKVYNLTSFQQQYEALLTLSVCDTIPNLIWEKDETTLLSQIDWDNMLSIASLFCYNEENKYVDAALRIAQTCILQESCTENQKNASAFILDTLTNKPAIKLAVTKQYLKESYKDNLPFSLKLQQCKSDYEHTIVINDDIITLNRFQKEVYAAYKSNETISISAPTSAGKSYILCTLILEELSKGHKNIVYVVPTRALISQVDADLRALLKQYNLETQTNITTVPPQEAINTEVSNIYVFTQERLHWFLFGNNSTSIDLLIVDEAHKIGNIQKILKRKNSLIRPAVANVDQALVIFAATKPEPNLNLLDRFLISMEQQAIPCIICFNKCDLADEERIAELSAGFGPHADRMYLRDRCICSVGGGPVWHGRHRPRGPFSRYGGIRKHHRNRQRRR